MNALPKAALVFSAALGIGGCGADAPTRASPVAPSLVATVPIPASVAARPFSGTCEITSTQVLGFNPPILDQLSTAVCTATHLGRIDLRNVQQINVATGVQTGNATYTTANGDLVYASSAGAATPTGATTISFTGQATIAGGTGRFAQATGQLHVAGTADNATGTGSFTYDGWIAYDAARRHDH